jgi:hypothetical protein
MKLTMERLRKIIAEEYARAERLQESRRIQRRRRRLAEGTAENPIQITPEYLNRIIKEELEAHNRRQRLAEARRRARRY